MLVRVQSCAVRNVRPGRYSGVFLIAWRFRGLLTFLHVLPFLLAGGRVMTPIGAAPVAQLDRARLSQGGGPGSSPGRGHQVGRLRSVEVANHAMMMAPCEGRSIELRTGGGYDRPLLFSAPCCNLAHAALATIERVLAASIAAGARCAGHIVVLLHKAGCQAAIQPYDVCDAGFGTRSGRPETLGRGIS